MCCICMRVGKGRAGFGLFISLFVGFFLQAWRLVLLCVVLLVDKNMKSAARDDVSPVLHKAD